MASKSFGNNNPGNIVASAFARRRGGEDLDGDGFANFRSSALGFRAMIELLSSGGYQGLSIQKAIERWAPVQDGNDPQAYTDFVCRATDLPAWRVLIGLNTAEMASLAWAMAMYEGWHS